MILVKKKNGKLQVYIDYKTLNKYTLKDYFLFLFINTILDEVERHQLYTFMDGYLGYNQIWIVLVDYYKIVFTTPWSTFIYVVILFGLCNVSTTFKNIISYAFLDLLYKSMILFIDDFSVQSTAIDHIEFIKKVLIRYQ